MMVWEKGGVFGSVVVVGGEQDEWMVSRWKKRPGTGMCVWPNVSVFYETTCHHLPAWCKVKWAGQFHMVTRPHLRCLLGGLSAFFFFFFCLLWCPERLFSTEKMVHKCWRVNVCGSSPQPREYENQYECSRIVTGTILRRILCGFTGSLQWDWTTVIHGGNQLSHASLHWCSLLPPPASSAPWEWSPQQTPWTQNLVEDSAFGEFKNHTTRLAEMRQCSRDIHPKWMKPCYIFFLVREDYPSFLFAFCLLSPHCYFRKVEL